MAGPMAGHPWMPASPCGPGCVAVRMSTVGRIRRGARLVRAVLVLLGSVLVSPLLVVLPARVREALVRLVFRGVLHAFGVRVDVHGEAMAGRDGHRGGLVVDNHVSWLDIVVINAVRPMRSVAKKEIASWPVVGALAGRAGTVYLDRERLRALPDTVAELAGALRGGSLVNVCPEGTTWCGLGLGRFRPALFQAAIDGGVPVRPIALRYRVAGGGPTTWPAFIGDETLIDSVRRVATLRGLVIDVHVLPEIAPGRAADRHELAALAEAAIRDALYGDMPTVPHGMPHGVRDLGKGSALEI